MVTISIRSRQRETSSGGHGAPPIPPERNEDRSVVSKRLCSSRRMNIVGAPPMIVTRLALDQGEGLIRVEGGLKDNRCPDEKRLEQRVENAPDGAEGDRREQSVARRHALDLGAHQRVVDERAVGVQAPLRCAGRTRRVDEQRRVVAAEAG